MAQDPASLPTVLNEFEMENSFGGKILEVCVVTEDAQRAQWKAWYGWALDHFRCTRSPLRQ
ncbi:MAG: hypothetical protein QOJ80_4882 [Mycobacterium sp.]|jgi:hypothetical protein|nr:hypothetical protein [Mycobacterium sp.]